MSASPSSDTQLRRATGERCLLSLYDGRLLLGRIVEEGGRCHATTAAARDLGTFQCRKAAVAAIGEAQDARRLDRHQGAASFDHELEDILDPPRGGVA